jgi:hypothetical protein
MSALEKEISGVYLDMHKGFKHQSKVLHLKKSLNGLIKSPRNWFLCLKENFSEAGLKQIEYDAFLCVSDRVICTVYVDDTLEKFKTRVH